MDIAQSLKDFLDIIVQGLTIPVILLLICFIIYALFCIGSVLVELIFERRHYKVALPALLRALDGAQARDIPDVIGESGLLLRQKKALLVLFRNRDLHEEARWALAKKLLLSEKRHYDRITGRNDVASRVAPMIGLMGTLIPLGPGILGLSTGDVDQLASSLLVAFNTTVAGLVAAAVTMVVSKVRKGWYSEYAAALEAAVTTILEKIDLLEKADELDLSFDEAERVEHANEANREIPAPMQSEGVL